MGMGVEKVKNEVGEEIEIVCASCNGLKYYVRDKIDTTAIMEELDYIHSKVTAIWNKVKNL
jgi:hypothetical protein